LTASWTTEVLVEEFYSTMLEQVFRCSIKHLDVMRLLLRQYFRDFVRDFVIFGDLLHSAFWNYAELVELGVLLLYGGDTKNEERVLRTLEISRHSAVNNPFRPATLMRIFALFCIFDNFLCEARSLAFDLHPVASFFRSVSYRAVRMPALCAEEQNVFSSFCSFRPLWSTVLPWWASFV